MTYQCQLFDLGFSRRPSSAFEVSENAAGPAQWGRRDGSKPSIGRNSENAALPKPQQSLGGGVLGDVTNLAVVENQTKQVLAAPTIRQLGLAPPLPSRGAVMTNIADRVEPEASLAEDAQQVMEYLPDIFHVLQREELLHAPSPGYIDLQVHVNIKMRAILVDWLVSVQQKYKLKAETLFLAVNLIDRHLELKATARRNLQLVGVTGLFIAAKFEEIHPPQIKDLVHVTDKAYTRDDIMKMEVVMLGALDYKICSPTPMHFFERYQLLNTCSETQRDLAQYLLELALVDYSMIQYPPSTLAAAAVLLSSKLLRRQPAWSVAAVNETHFAEHMLNECAKQMCPLLENAELNSLQAVRKKFSQSKYHSVAKLSFTQAPSAPAVGGDRRRSIGGNEARPPASSVMPEKVAAI